MKHQIACHQVATMNPIFEKSSFPHLAELSLVHSEVGQLTVLACLQELSIDSFLGPTTTTRGGTNKNSHVFF